MFTFSLEDSFFFSFSAILNLAHPLPPHTNSFFFCKSNFFYPTYTNELHLRHHDLAKRWFLYTPMNKTYHCQCHDAEASSMLILCCFTVFLLVLDCWMTGKCCRPQTAPIEEFGSEFTSFAHQVLFFQFVPKMKETLYYVRIVEKKDLYHPVNSKTRLLPISLKQSWLANVLWHPSHFIFFCFLLLLLLILLLFLKLKILSAFSFQVE